MSRFNYLRWGRYIRWGRFTTRVARVKVAALKDERINLLTLRTPISNGALSGKLPERIKLLSWGENPSVKGVIRVNERTIAHLAQDQGARGFGEVALDFEHNTVPGSAEYERSQEPRKVAAYGVPKVVPNEGLYLEGLRWTPTGQAEALNFADLSPAVQTEADGTVRFLHSVALVRNGAVEGLSFFSVDLKGENHMEKTNILTLTAVAAALGLGAEATEAEVCGKLKTLSAPATAPDLKPLEEKIAALEGKLTTLSAELSAGTTAAVEREKGELIARFSAEGRVPKNGEGQVYSAEELKGLDVATLKLLHANTPVTVSLSARAGTVKEGKGREGLKGLALAIAAHADK